MSKQSKIRFFLFITTIAALLASCNRKANDVIPDVYVNFTIDLNDPEFVNLTALLGSAYVDYNTNNWGYSSSGFNNNGIIVFSGPDAYYAFDRTCPHDYAVNGLSIKVNIVDVIYAECPHCKTRYALTNFGTPTSDSIGRYPLKNYKTSFDGRYVSVWNH
jgi:nitrite reductase/ring-hydroxylating ferredoxin subunit